MAVGTSHFAWRAMQTQIITQLRPQFPYAGWNSGILMYRIKQQGKLTGLVMLAGLSNRLQAAPFLGDAFPVSFVKMVDTSLSIRCCSLSSRELLRILFVAGTVTPLPSDDVRFTILLPP